MKNYGLYILFLGLLLNCDTAKVDLINAGKQKEIYIVHKGALLSSSFDSFESFQKIVDIQYSGSKRNPKVILIHNSNGKSVVSKMTAGYSDNEIRKAQHEGIFKKLKVIFSEPLLLYYGEDLRKIWSMVRKRQNVFGADDVAVFNFAEKMVDNIYDHDKARMSEKDLSEKGYLNSFNHINGQAMMTSLFTERFADYIADLHERGNMPELVTGKFTKKQVEDLEFGPVDNYIDIINNEWGQEMGKMLKHKYDIDRNTIWTPTLVASYMNDLQAYYSWSFQIGFKPFYVDDPLVMKFAKKLNVIMSGESLK